MFDLIKLKLKYDNYLNVGELGFESLNKKI